MMKHTFVLVILLAACGITPVLADSWRSPAPDRLVYLTTEQGTSVIELAPELAPKHVQRFTQLVNNGFYDGLSFYRVIDGFVAQAGDIAYQDPQDKTPPLQAEFTVSPIPDQYMAIESNDFKAPQTGYFGSFSVGADHDSNELWMLHCPGVIALARNNDKHSATTDFYIVIGQAPRHLDRNMSAFGRVIYGLEHIQALKRADHNNASGMIEDPSQQSQILSMRMASNVPIEERLTIQVQAPHSDAVKARLEGARKMDNPFYHFTANSNLDLCYHQLKTRRVDDAAETKKAG